MDRPALLSEIQNGLPPLSEMPQGLTRLASVRPATPAKSDTKLVCNTVPGAAALAGVSSAPAAVGIRQPAASKASTANSGWGRRPKHDSLGFMLGLLRRNRTEFVYPDKTTHVVARDGLTGHSRDRLPRVQSIERGTDHVFPVARMTRANAETFPPLNAKPMRGDR